MTTQTQFDLTAVKSRQQATWSSGRLRRDWHDTRAHRRAAVRGPSELRPGQLVLDVAAANGNATLAAARRWGAVTSTDYVAALLEHGRAKAAAERLPVTFPGSRRRGFAVRRRLVRRGALGLRRDVYATSGAGGTRGCCASAGPAGRLAWPAGPRRALSAMSSARLANTSRQPPA